ncbi:MAG: transketolase [Dehalococcoidia bacterium]
MQTHTTRERIDQWRDLAAALRVDSIRVSAAAHSGHPTSSLSAADLMAVLLAGYLRYDFAHPERATNDHLIFSKGHASPLLYAMFHAAGAVSDAELLTFRTLGSRLQGHPTPVLPWVDVATGSLGQGLPIGVGLALTARRLDHLDYRTWVLCGDGEMAEGSMWEALEHAGYWGLGNLTAILDVNRLGQSGPTMHGWDLGAYSARARACGWTAIEIDGHDLQAIDQAYRLAVTEEARPTLIVARTVKGEGAPAVADREGQHGRPLDDAKGAIEALGGAQAVHVVVTPPSGDGVVMRAPVNTSLVAPQYALGSQMSTRRAYGEALAALGSARGDIVALDAEVKNSTYAELFAQAHPERYIELFIAEQQLVATAVATQVRGWTPYASTFAAFQARSYDFVRMAAVSRANVKLVGSHAGVSVGEDGPSQMGLEDLAMFRAVLGSTVLYPCDANQTAWLVDAMADLDGIVYLRTTREATPVIYASGEAFAVGGSRVLRASTEDRATVVAAGITVHEALAAAQQLADEGVVVRVIDAYSVKPIDAEVLRTAAVETGRIVTVEDHQAEGGLGEAVLSALAASDASARVRLLAVRELPGSGQPAELRGVAGIDATHIAQAVRDLLADG